MSDDMENVLRNSLDAVDRGRRWAMLGLAALCASTLLAVGSLFALAASRTPETAGVLKALFVASIAQMLFTACCTVALMFHTSRVTKVILRVLEANSPVPRDNSRN